MMLTARTFLNIPFLLTLLLSISFSTQATEVVTYYANDALGSPILATDEAGNVLWQEQYDPYGKRIVKHVNSSTDELFYTNKQEEADLGLQYFGARWYDPELGRFISMDPVSVQDYVSTGSNVIGFNRYAYANNNPYRYIDPNGESPVDIGFFALDAIALGVAIGSGNPVAIQRASVDLALSTVGLVSPVPGSGQALKVLNAGNELRKGAKRGPKTNPNAPHNAKIREVGDRVVNEGGTILAGGGRKAEKLLPTPGGNKNGRRPDVLYKDCHGALCGINVGRARPKLVTF